MSKKIKDMTFRKTYPFESDVLFDTNVFVKTNYGIKLTKLTILDRMTGFGHRDIETGYRDIDRRFWLVSGGFDIREYPELSVQQAIECIKDNANSSTGNIPNLAFKKAFEVKTRLEVKK